MMNFFVEIVIDVSASLIYSGIICQKEISLLNLIHNMQHMLK